MKLKVQRSSSGLGLFAKEFIKKGLFIVEYTGEIISGQEADRRGGRYLFDISGGRVIDGSARDNLARYINHSCRPNAEARTYGGRVRIYAKRRIREGEEIAYHYGKEYFDDIIKPEGCRCSRCRSKRAR
jgi:hypothetical protein